MSNAAYKPLPFKFNGVQKYELWRADTFWTKEPGTITWLESLTSDDVLVDVGANIGLYSLYAAKFCKHVYAFEPHMVNAQSLLQNVADNQLQDKITVFSVGLGERSCYQPFHYLSLRAGTSGSQVNEPVLGGQTFTPIFTEMKRVETLDDLVLSGVIQPPTAVKIDVDGRELKILTGFSRGLWQAGMRTVQVEMHTETAQWIKNFMGNLRWQEGDRHDTAKGSHEISRGANPDVVEYNQIFQKAA